MEPLISLLNGNVVTKAGAKLSKEKWKGEGLRQEAKVLQSNKDHWLSHVLKGKQMSKTILPATILQLHGKGKTSVHIRQGINKVL